MQDLFFFCAGCVGGMRSDVRNSKQFFLISQNIKKPYSAFKDFENCKIILYHVEPLLCNDRKIGEYTRTFLGKGSINTFPLLGSCNSWTTTEETVCFLCGPCRGVNLDNWGDPI
jgi:hypothetical protein